MRFLPQFIAWFVAAAWIARAFAALRGIPTVPNLRQPVHDIAPPGSPTITVIVPARNEQNAVRATLESLLAQDYPTRIIAIDDRSTDTTGAIMDSLAGDRLTAIHITELPPQWLGKTHAMAQAAALAAESDFLLFTDADILFAPSAIRRALASAVTSRADHLVLAPTTIIRRWDEAALLAFFPVVGLWAARPWKVADPAAQDAIGIGAFNLLRTSAYRQIGGFESLRMEIVEDLGLARRIKLAGLNQRFVFGPGLIQLHWAAGFNGIVNVMTKNIFSVFRFRIPFLLGGCAWLALFWIMPFIAIWSKPLTLPAAIVVAAIFLAYRSIASVAPLNPWNAFLAPVAASLFLYAMLRSMAITVWQGGVTWRGTFYPLAELRKYTKPLFPPKG